MTEDRSNDITPEAAGASPYAELGVAGLTVAGGRVIEEYLPQLRGPLGARVFRDMADNDATVGAILHTIDMLIRRVDWRVEPAAEGGEAAEQDAAFARSVLDDMSQNFADVVSEALTMLIYGFAVFEIVYKRRAGPDGQCPSRADDGRIGIRKLAARAQTTVSEWLFDEEGGLDGLIQVAPDGRRIALPIEKCLLFRTVVRKNNPEGRSILRNAYRPWYFLKNVQEVEAIAIERDLAGLPVVSIPTAFLTDPKKAELREAYIRIARDLKFGEDGGIVIPSDTYPDKDGNPTGTPLVRIELLSTGGQRQVDTAMVKLRYQQDIARSVLADFLMLGSQGASHALSISKTDLFTVSLETWLAAIASVFNSHLWPRLWALNGMDPATLPRLVPGEVAATDLGQLGSYLQALAGAGATLFPDDALNRHLRAVADLPPPTGVPA